MRSVLHVHINDKTLAPALLVFLPDVGFPRSHTNVPLCKTIARRPFPSSISFSSSKSHTHKSRILDESTRMHTTLRKWPLYIAELTSAKFTPGVLYIILEISMAPCFPGTRRPSIWLSLSSYEGNSIWRPVGGREREREREREERRERTA